MCWKVILYELVFLVLHAHFVSSSHLKSKRSPLEIGFVEFTLPNHHSATVHHGVTIHVPTVVLNEHNVTASSGVSSKSHMVVTHNDGALYVHRTHWEPGHVHNHAFIPGRVHNVLVPTHALLVAHPVHAVLLHPTVSVAPEVNVFRKHYGGFGVGVDVGGHGAGHGFHVL